jgi:hypothetical protein
MLATLVTVVALGALTRVHAADGMRIIPLVRDGKVLVSVQLEDAFTSAVREAIASGLRTTFTYELELRTVVPAWIDRTIATTVITTSDQYDNLTRRHTLTRTVDGRIQETLVTEDEKTVESWLTTWSRLPLCDTSKLDPARDYYVRITTRARPLGGSLLGLVKTVTGQAKFTFIP